MPSLKKDVVANTVGQAWAVAVNLLFVPFFVHRLGVEGYAVVALLPVFSALVQVLDLGLAMTLNREMARASAAGGGHAARSTAWTLQIGHLALGVVVGMLALWLIPLAGVHWLQPQEMSLAELRSALLLLAMVVVVQWPVALFQNGLMGLGLQARVNVLLAGQVSLANGGAALLFLFSQPTLTTFFGWFALCATLHSAALAALFWKALAGGPTARFDRAVLQQQWRFSRGAAGINMTGAALMHADRIVASRLLSLEQFGYYGLATTIGRSVYLLIAPLFSAAFPRLSGLIAKGDREGLEHMYSISTQLMVFSIMPPAAVVFWMSFDVAHFWLGSASTAAAVGSPAALLVLGAAINGVMNLPYALQLACGLTSLGLRINLVLLVLVFPVAYLLFELFGAIGVAATWPLLNALYFLIGVPLTQRLTGYGRAGQWLFGDVLPAVTLNFAAVGIVQWVMEPGVSRFGSALNVGVALVVGYVCALLTTTRLRQEAVAAWRRLRTIVL